MEEDGGPRKRQKMHPEGVNDSSMRDACKVGNLELVKSILEEDLATLNSPNEVGITPLICAAQNNHLELIKFLLDKGVHIDYRTPTTTTPDAPRYANAVKSLLGYTDAHFHLEVMDLGLTALDMAAQNGHLETVKLLLERGAAIDLTNDFRPLFAASQNGHLEVVRLLLDRGASIDLVNDGFTSLNIAAKSGHLEVVRLLLERGAAVDFTPLGFSSLYLACCNGHLEVARLLIDRGADIEFAANTDKNNPLICASLNGHAELVKLLLERGAQVDLAEVHGQTPLLVACCGGHLEAVKLLLDRGANVEASSQDGDTPLIGASSSGNVELVRLLLDRGANVDFTGRDGRLPSLATAALAGHLEVVKLLLDRGANVDLETSAITPIQLASQKGHLDVVVVLLDAGASVKSSLHFAAQNGHVDLAKFLLGRGVSVDLEMQNITPIGCAASHGRLEMVKFLMANGALVNSAAKAGNGSTALLAASCSGHLEVVEFLLDSGADANQGTREKVTPLSLASRNGHFGVVKLLFERGADVNLGDFKNYCPLHEGSRNGHLEVVKFLLDKGANINAATQRGSTPLVEAAFGQRFEVVKFLVDSGANVDARACQTALLKSYQVNRWDIWELMIRARPQLVVEEKPSLLLAAQSDSPESYQILKLLIENGAHVDHIDKTDAERTALHMAVKQKQARKVWLLIMNGADMNIPYLAPSVNMTVWQLCEKGDKDTYEALLHFWTPQTHHLHPPWFKEAAKQVLLIAKRLKWPFDRPLLQKIISHIAFGWYKKLENNENREISENQQLESGKQE